MALIAMEKVEKCYTTGCRTVHALSGIDLTVERGEMVAILGRSGSGKSTLMNLLGCLDTPTAGHYRLDGQPVDEMTPGQLARVRSRTVGFVFQSFHLLPGLTALENVALPLSYRGLPQKRREQIAAACLARVGLSDRMTHRPAQLSGGQQQRVAIARAIAGQPPLLLADEPTGNLDRAAGEQVMALLLGWHRAGNTVILITHDEQIGAACPRCLRMRDGRLLGADG